MLKIFFWMFDYDSWANRECLAAMRSAADSVSPDIVGRMAHILSAQKLWLERILSTDTCNICNGICNLQRWSFKLPVTNYQLEIFDAHA